MRWIERIRARLPFARLAAESPIDSGMAHRVEAETERLVREEGLDRTAARSRAQRTLSPVANVKRPSRSPWEWGAGLIVDLKLGSRMLVKYPGLTVVGTLALSIAIAGGVTYFEFVKDIYDPTLPVPQAERMIGIRNWNVSTKGDPVTQSLHDFVLWRQQLKSVDRLGAISALEGNLITDDGRAEPARGVSISASAFRLFPVLPLLGRVLLDSDEDPAAPAVMVIGADLWKARFNEDPKIIGRTVRLGSARHTVVGVMPVGFAFPGNHSLWVPFRQNPVAYSRGKGPQIEVFGRLAPDVKIEQAQAELSTIGLRAAADFPETNQHLRPLMKPYIMSIMSDNESVGEGRILYAFNIFALALLGVCGANIATLVFARTATRENEITVRTALGATRSRIIAQLFAEALVLTSLATVIGVSAATFGLRWVRDIMTNIRGEPLPFWWNEHLSLATVIYAATLMVGAAACIGILPALKATGQQLQSRLKGAAQGGSQMQFGRLWTGVIVAQVAFTVFFLLMIISVVFNARSGRFMAPQAAFRADQYLAAQFSTYAPPPAEGDAKAQAEFRATLEANYLTLERALVSDPAVLGVTYGSRLPGTEQARFALEVDNATSPDGSGSVHTVRTALVAANFFETFERPIISGRGFTPDDLESGRNVIVVDQTFATKILAGRNPIGTRVRQLRGLRGEEPGPWNTIVGVVSDLATPQSARANVEDVMFYRPVPPRAAVPFSIAVRVRGSDPQLFAPKLRSLTAAVDPILRLTDVTPLNEISRGDQMTYEIFMRIFAVVAAIALLLSITGVYSLMSFTVARRTREIGVRAALGADSRRIIASTFFRGFLQVGAGVLAGSIPGGLLLTFGAPEGIRGAGPLVGIGAFLAVSLLIVGVGVLACVVPGRRALRIAPASALRADV